MDSLGTVRNFLLLICRLEDLGFRIFCEQVSHHPPISAFHADSPLFRFYGSIHPKLKFWGRSIEIQPKGIVTLELLKYMQFTVYSMNGFQ